MGRENITLIYGDTFFIPSLNIRHASALLFFEIAMKSQPETVSARYAINSWKVVKFLDFYFLKPKETAAPICLSQVYSQRLHAHTH